jgi:hypothetical protein
VVIGAAAQRMKGGRFIIETVEDLSRAIFTIGLKTPVETADGRTVVLVFERDAGIVKKLIVTDA